MTPEELGDTLARLVWESFSDFVAEGDTEISLGALGVPTHEGCPTNTRRRKLSSFSSGPIPGGMQLAFVGRAPDALVRRGLDALHRAVFEDMAENGRPAHSSPSSSSA